MQQTILTLKKYVDNDFNTYYEMVRHDEVMRYITGKGSSPEEAREKFNAMLAINQSHQEIGYFNVLANDGTVIGLGKLEWYEKDATKLELGYILRKEFWGKGYATAICREMLDLADKAAPHADVIGIIDPDNEASKRILQTFGFKSYFTGIEDNLPTEKLLLSKQA